METDPIIKDLISIDSDFFSSELKTEISETIIIPDKNLNNIPIGKNSNIYYLLNEKNEITRAYFKDTKNNYYLIRNLSYSNESKTIMDKIDSYLISYMLEFIEILSKQKNEILKTLNPEETKNKKNLKIQKEQFLNLLKEYINTKLPSHYIYEFVDILCKKEYIGDFYYIKSYLDFIDDPYIKKEISYLIMKRMVVPSVYLFNDKNGKILKIEVNISKNLEFNYYKYVDSSSRKMINKYFSSMFEKLKLDNELGFNKNSYYNQVVSKYLERVDDDELKTDGKNVIKLNAVQYNSYLKMREIEDGGIITKHKYMAYTFGDKFLIHDYDYDNYRIADSNVFKVVHNGGFLSLPTGYGKTATILFMIMKTKNIESFDVYNENYVGTTLIVVPNLVIGGESKDSNGNVEYNGWIGEILEKFKLSYIDVSDLNSINATDLIDKDIAIIRQSMLHKKIDHLKKIKFKRLVVDEIHNAKSKKTSLFKSLIQINANYKWLLSATLTPNRVMEFASYFEILNITQYKNTKYFKQITTLGEKNIYYTQFINCINNIVFRAEFKSVIDAGTVSIKDIKFYPNPEKDKLETYSYKIPIKLNTDLTQYRSYYQKLLDESKYKTKETKRKRFEFYEKDDDETEINYTNDGDLFEDTEYEDDEDDEDDKNENDDDDDDESEDYNEDIKISKRAKRTKTKIEKPKSIISISIKPKLIIDQSPNKFGSMIDLISKIKSNDITKKDKIIIVSSYYLVVKKVCDLLETKNYKYLSLLNISKANSIGNKLELVKDVDKTINEFKKEVDKDILVCTFKSIKEGKNIECANHMILLDPEWNVDEYIQIIGRIRRIHKQNKNTYIYRYYIENYYETKDEKEEIEKSMEAEIIELQDKKLKSMEAFGLVQPN